VSGNELGNPEIKEAPGQKIYPLPENVVSGNFFSFAFKFLVQLKLSQIITTVKKQEILAVTWTFGACR